MYDDAGDDCGKMCHLNHILSLLILGEIGKRSGFSGEPGGGDGFSVQDLGITTAFRDRSLEIRRASAIALGELETSSLGPFSVSREKKEITIGEIGDNSVNLFVSLLHAFIGFNMICLLEFMLIGNLAAGDIQKHLPAILGRFETKKRKKKR